VKTKIDVKRGVSYRDMIGFVVVVLRDMQVLIPLFVMLVIDEESMKQCSVHYLSFSVNWWMKGSREPKLTT
jgi:hypothetical protein